MFEDIQKVCSLKIPEFWPPQPPLFAFLCFQAPLSLPPRYIRFG